MRRQSAAESAVEKRADLGSGAGVVTAAGRSGARSVQAEAYPAAHSVICSFFIPRGEAVEQRADGSPGLFDGSGVGLAQQGLHFAKTCSISGLRSASSTVHQDLALAARMATRERRGLFGFSCSTSPQPGARIGRTCSTSARKLAPLIGPSMTQGAVSRSHRNAARKVSVCHLPKGALATRRAPLASTRTGSCWFLLKSSST